MFRLKSLSIANIRSIEKLDIAIDPNGVTALFGPSGVGKSGILDSLPWCLWGDSGATTMRREGSTDPAEVTATIQIGDDTVVASRRQTRSKSGTETTTAKLWINGAKQTNITSTSLTRIITERTGLTAKTFRGAFYMAQDQLTHLIVGTPAQVQNTFEELTGLDELSRTITRLRDQYKEARIHADVLPGDPEDVSRTTENAEEANRYADTTKRTADAATADAATARAAWEAADGSARQLRQQQLDARASLDAVIAAEAIVAEADTALATATAEVSASGGDPSRDPAVEADLIRSRVRQLEAAIADLTNRGAALKAATQAQEAAYTVGRAARVEFDAVDVAALTARSEQAESDHGVARQAVIDAERASTRAEDTHARLVQAVNTLDRLDPTTVCCPTCQQSLPDTAAFAATMRQQLAAAELETSNAARALSRVRAQESEIDKHVRQTRQDLAAANAVMAKLEHARAAAKTAEAYRREAATELASAVTQISGGPAPTDPEQVRYAALHAHSTLTAQLTTARALCQAQDTARAAADRVRAAAGELRRRRSVVLQAPESTQVEAAVAEADDHRRQLDAAHAAAADATADARAARVGALQLVDLADDAAKKWAAKQSAMTKAEEARIGRDLVIALRRDLLGEYCDTISAAATDVLMRLGGEQIGFLLDSTFVPQIVLPDGSTRATRQLSGGEKARAAVCAFIGISRQLAGGGSPLMIIADEITAAQDEVFRREILTMLRSLEMPLIVVSHTADVLDIASTVIRLQRPPLGATSIAA